MYVLAILSRKTLLNGADLMAFSRALALAPNRFNYFFCGFLRVLSLGKKNSVFKNEQREKKEGFVFRNSFSILAPR